MELEENREISFLDVCIKRDHNTFSTTIHHKKTFTGLYTKWDSFTPRTYKVNLIRLNTYLSLLTHLFKIHFIAVHSIRSQEFLASKWLSERHHKDKPSQPTLTVPKKDVILVLPYLGLHSDAITRRLKSCVNKFYGFCNLRVVFQNTNRIKSFSPYKDRFNGSQKSKIVYKASGWNCDAFYQARKGGGGGAMGAPAPPRRLLRSTFLLKK